MKINTIKRRLILALKCVLGKEIEPSVKTHKYKIYLSDEAKFNGKSVLVTGATGAIGSAICYQLAALGATVGFCGRNKEKIDSMIELIRLESPSVAQNMIPIILDINDDTLIETAIKKFVEKVGKIDVMVNNAGGQPGRVGNYSTKLCEQTVDQIDLILDTNLRGTIMCSREVSKYMLDQGFGQIINISSVIGIGGKAGYSDYAATKAGIIGFTKSYALELSVKNIRVNCISPGLINQTPFDEGSNERYTNLTALKRAGYTKEIADTVTFLMENEFITGQNIIVDGGRSLGLFGDN